MGGVSIWGMHYIGNCAIRLGGKNHTKTPQLFYSVGYTLLSFFVPVGFLLATFFTIGQRGYGLLRVTIGGALSGFTICGMHYLGQQGIYGYSVHYHIANIIGSVIIAVVASISALCIFFILHSSWTDTWWKRCLTALVLAGAVSGMHWVAELGTVYRFIGSIDDSNLSRTSLFTIVIVLVCLPRRFYIQNVLIIQAIASCAILLSFSILAHSRELSADRAQQVYLATASFDKDGNILITQDGILPYVNVTHPYDKQVSH
jgi:NO-binding membrane sensor protein with MHYT domain